MHVYGQCIYCYITGVKVNGSYLQGEGKASTFIEHLLTLTYHSLNPRHPTEGVNVFSLQTEKQQFWEVE